LEPRHVVYNLSEAALGKIITASLKNLVDNSLLHLRRVYPKGTRITSANLSPVKHWRSGKFEGIPRINIFLISPIKGTHISALNWQKYDRGLQFNEAMFVGSGGWVVKPEKLRGLKQEEKPRNVRLTCEVVGACNSMSLYFQRNNNSFVTLNFSTQSNT